MNSAGWRVPINVKLLVILAVPVLGYMIIASTAVLQAQQEANRISDQASVVNTAVGPISLTTSLIDEQTISGLEAAGLSDDLTLRIGNSDEARRATDGQLTALQQLIAGNPAARDAYQPAVDEVTDGLANLRAEIDAGEGDDASLFTRYDAFIINLMDANAAAVDKIDDAEFWQGAMLSELATRQKHARALLINAIIPITLNSDAIDDPRQTVAIGSALSAYENRDTAIRELATGPYARAGSVLAEAIDAADLSQMARDTLESGSIDSHEFFDLTSYKGGFVYDRPSGDYIHDSFRATVVEILDQNAHARTAAADRDVRNHLLAGSIGLVVTAGIAFLVSRSITRPLRSLTQQAIETATYRLPETVNDILETPLGEDVTWPQMPPIQVTTSDEVADVAHAFNTMQQSALDLAVEEAVLRRLVTDSLVTLGQRNQELLGRQLDFITDLERGETDPDTLADLFYLDHLAVRMRRNAESLLVLAGIDPPRTWLGPTQVKDVIRAGLGEAEEFKRVDVQNVDPATVAGFATAELSHLLAELIENALRFSTRNEAVEVSGELQFGEDDMGPGYTVTITDAGIGMKPEEIEQANRRLSGVEAYTVAPSRYVTPSKHMGHYVTGRLAARHGIAVQLHANRSGQGITATVDLPPSVLTADAPHMPDTALPPLPQPDWDADTAEVTTPDLRLLDLSAPMPVDAPSPMPMPMPGPAEPEEPVPAAPPAPAAEVEGPPIELPPVPAAAPATAPSTERAVPPRPRKRRKRPLGAGKLPVPPMPSEPLAIQPLEAPPPDTDEADSGQAI